MQRTPFTTDALNTLLLDLPHWELDGEAIVREFSFPTFMAAITFVTRVAEVAERIDHHPDLDIRYNRVIAHLSTHDAGGVTEFDARLAREMDRLVDEE